MRYLSVAFIACILLCSGCSRSAYKTELDYIDSLIQNEDTSALSLLNQIKDENKKLSEPDRMRYQLLLADAHNKFYISLENDTFMCDVAKYYSSHENKGGQMKSLYLLGCVYRDKGDVPMAIEKYNLAVEKADTTLSDCNYYLLCRIYAQMAALFHNQRSPQLELKMWAKAIPYAWKAKDTLSAINYYEHSAYAYDMLGKSGKVTEINKNAYRQYIACGHPEYAAGCLTVMINNEIKNKQLKQAKKHIAEYVNYSGAFDKNGEIINGRELFFYYVGKYYEAASKIDSAQFYYYKLLSYPNNILNVEYGCRGLLSVYTQKHITDSVEKYARLYADIKDSVSFLKSSEEVTRAQALYNYNENKEIANKKTKENKQLLFLIHSAIIILCIIGIISFYIVRKKVSRQKRQQKIENRKYTSLLFRYNKASEELKSMQSNINDYMKKKEEDIKQLEEQLSIYKYTPVNYENYQQDPSLLHISIVKRMHEAARHAKSANENDWIEINEMVSSLLPDFYHQVSQAELTKQELRTCILIRLSFIPSEIATLLNTTKQRISNIRISINKKLFHQSGTSGLDEQIHAI